MKRLNSQGTRTKEKLITVALQCLAENGVHKVSFQMIAEAGGFDRPLVSYYFKKKERIFLDVWNHYYQQAILATQEKLSAAGTAVERLNNYVQISNQIFTQRPEIARLYIQIYYLSVFDEEIRQVNTTVKRAACQRISKIIMDGQRTEEFRTDIDPYLTAKMIHNSVTGVFINSISEFEDFSRVDILQEFINRMTESLVRHRL